MTATSHAIAGDPTLASLPPARRVAWSAVIAGVFLAVAAQLVFSLLGAWLGLSTIDPVERSSPDASAIGMSALVWWAVSSAIALFIAGAVASHLAGSVQKIDASLHGLLTWAVAALASVYLLTSVAGMVTRGISGIIGTAATVTASGAAAIAGPAAEMVKSEMDARGISVESIKADALKLLNQTGKAQLNPASIAAAASGAAMPMAAGDRPVDLEALLDRIMNAGKAAVSQVDRDAAVDVVVARAAVSRPEAEQRVDGWISAFQQAQAKIAAQTDKAEQTAREVADATARTSSFAALGGVIVLLVGAVAAAVGGLAGRSRVVYRAAM